MNNNNVRQFWTLNAVRVAAGIVVDDVYCVANDDDATSQRAASSDASIKFL